MSTEPVISYKLLVLGPVATNICVQFWQDYSTEELNFGSTSTAKIIDIDGTKCALELIYTTGQTDTLFPNHQDIRDADGFIIVYNSNEYSSFDKVKDFITTIQHIKDSEKIPIILAANADPKAIKVITAEKGMELAKNYDIPFFNISLRRHIVKDVVVQCVKEIRKQKPQPQVVTKASNISNIKNLFGRRFNNIKPITPDDNNDDCDTPGRATNLIENADSPKVEASLFTSKTIIDYEGWLTKRGGKIHSWKLRYFRLCGDTLHYFKSLEDTAARGSIALLGCKVQRADDLLKKQFCFELSSKKMERHYYICAKNENEAETWVNQILKNIVLKTPRKDKLNKLADMRALYDRQVITELDYYKYQEQIIKELLQETYSITHPKDKDDTSMSETEKNTVSAPAERERQYFMSLLIARDNNTGTDKSPSARTTQLTRSNSRDYRSFSTGWKPTGELRSNDELEGTAVPKFRDSTGRNSFSKHKFPGDLEDLMVSKATEMGYRESYVKGKLQELRKTIAKEEELTFDRLLYYIRDDGNQIKKSDSIVAPLKKATSFTNTLSTGTPPALPSIISKDPSVPEIPQYFLCPITHEIMDDPVVACDGYTYEREAMKKWIGLQKTSPMTGAPLINDSLTPNFVLKSMWKDWAEKNLKNKDYKKKL